MKNYILISCLILLVSVSCLKQAKEEFKPLFNGKDLTNWTLASPGGFEVVDNELITRSTGAGNDIFSEQQYANFVLRLEFMLSEVGNSGVFIRRNPLIPGDGFEVQLLAPWTPWRDDLHCTGSMYGHVAVTDRPDETTGLWYRMEIKCDRNIVTVSVNDTVTTVADIDTVLTMSDKSFSGLIGLQGNHAGEKDQFTKFRNIYIKDLDAEPEYVIKGFSYKNGQLRKLAGDAAVNLGAQMIQPLADLMSGDNPMVKSGAKQTLFDIVALASDPAGDEKMKKEVVVALKESIKTTTSEITSAYLLWLSGLVKR
jgi:3-keto-disaccharide hydrolase